MAERLVYHWRHGWIPLTHAAALSKAHGNSKAADKYVPGTSAHHGGRLTEGKSARHIHVGLEQHARLRARPGMYQGQAGHHITGTDTKGRKVGVFAPGDRASAQRAIDNVNAGRPAFASADSPLSPHSGAHLVAGPATEREAFRMKGPELRQHAANGSAVAQTELDRRAGKKGAPRQFNRPGTAAPASSAPAKPLPQAKSLTPGELLAQNKGDLKVGDKVSLKVTGGTNRVGTVQGFDQHGRPQVYVPGHGMTVRPAAEMSKEIHPATAAAEARRASGVVDYSKTPTETLQRFMAAPGVAPHLRDAVREELDRRGAPHVRPEPVADPRKADSLARWEAENRSIVPAGYSVKSRVSSTEVGGRHMGLHSVYSSKGERVGGVIDRKNGNFLALYNGKQLGDDYATRKDAFSALTAKHEAVSAREAKKAETAARRQATAVPVGIFHPHKIESDGTARGDAAAAKIKQSFKYNDHTVHIETAMTKEQTKAFLGDVHAVLLKSGHMDSEGITFHVPSGDSHFRQGRRGVTGGYVRRGQRTIFVNPKIANGELDKHFGGPGAGDSLMPAAGHTTGRQYVMTHELGHVVDNQHAHTFEQNVVTYPSGRAPDRYSTERTGDIGSLHRSQQGHLSKYGRSNKAEGYAEAYAQWIHGGPGSNPAADAYAAQFGWTPPKWYREGRKP